MNQSNKGRELSNEDVGVTLPFKRLVSSMVTIIVSGLIPVCILVFLFAWMAGLLPKTFLAALLVFCTVPVFSWSLYFLYLLVTVLVTKGFLNYYNKKSPAEPGVLVRQFKDRTHPDYRKLHYYHMRGAIIKYSIWIVQKCPFPTLLRRIMNFYGHNHIAANVIHENFFPGLEFTSVAEGAVLEIGSALSTHVVESIYGSLVLNHLTIGKNAVLGINSIAGPGIVIIDKAHLGDNCMAYQNWPLTRKQDSQSDFYNCSPAKNMAFSIMFADGDLKERYFSLVK